jgi:hypothetical protein
MRLVDRIEEDALQIARRVRPQRGADSRHRQRQAADDEETDPGIDRVIDPTGDAGHAASSTSAVM